METHMDDLSFASPFADVGQGGVDYAQMNRGVTPIFYTMPVKDEAATEREGVTRFRELEVVLIRVAGDMNSSATAPVDDGIKERFSAEYERWKRTQSNEVISGLSIREWPLLSATQIAEMKAAGIQTVEHLAQMSDANIVRIPDGRVWRQKAIAWLDAAKNGGDSARFAAESERLRADLLEMRKTVAEQAAMIADLASERRDDEGDEPARRRGRPPRVAA